MSNKIQRDYERVSEDNYAKLRQEYGDEYSILKDGLWLHVILSEEINLHDLGGACRCNPDRIRNVGNPGYCTHKRLRPNYYIKGTPQYPVPFGHYVLLRLTEYENVSEGGIILGTSTQEKREQEGQEVGEVMAFGPTAYMGFSGFEGPEAWGIKVGDIVEFKRYEGKKCELPGYELFHYIPDSLLIGGNRSAEDE